MSPLRSDPSLWFNLPGVVAAYQPVAAPDPLLARCSSSAIPRTLPTTVGSHAAMRWTAKRGLYPSAENAMTGIMEINYPGDQSWSMCLALDTIAETTAWEFVFGSYVASYYYTFRATLTPGVYRIYGGSSFATTGAGKRHVLMLSGNRAYDNGLAIGTTGSGTTGVMQHLGVHGLWYGSYVVANAIIANMLAIAIYGRTLSAAEVWHVSRQMQYCDANPEWNVWAPRRKWFPYVLAGAVAYQRRQADAGRVGSRGVVE